MRIASIVAGIAVLAAYVFFASGGTFEFPRLSDSGEAVYADLAEGFRNGRLSLWHDPVPQIAALPNPWDYESRKDLHYVWDASYFNGRYYLYFSPLPALIFYLPHRFVRGGYPSDELAGAFFSTWAFLAAVWFVRRATGGKTLIPFPLWVLLLGLGNVVVYSLSDPRIYEVSILCAMAMTATFACSLLRFNESPSVSRAAWVGVWLALSIAARPNLGMLLLIALPVVFLARHVKTIAAFLTPLAITAIAMVTYNYARFGELFEFGVRYQLTHVNMADHPRICGMASLAEAGRLCNHALHYLFWPFVVRTQFPFIEVLYARLDPKVSWPTPGSLTEQVIGLGPLVPIALIGAIFALFLIGRREAKTAVQITAAGWLVLLGLASCWWIVTRYSLDFMLLLVMSAIVCIELGLQRLREHGVRLWPFRALFSLLAIYSVIIGLLLGLVGPGEAFSRVHPDAFARVARLFHQ